METDELQFALWLIEDAIVKRRELEEYQKDLDNCRKYTYHTWEEFYAKWDKVPTKTAVLDDIKMARRLLNVARKEMDG